MKGNDDIYPPPPPSDKFIRETVNRIVDKYVFPKKLTDVYAVGFKWKPSKYTTTPVQIGFFFYNPEKKQHQFPFREIPRKISLLDLYGDNSPGEPYGFKELYSKYKVIGRFRDLNGNTSGSTQQQYFIQPGERIYGSTHAGQLSLGSIGGLLRFSQNVMFRNVELISGQFYVLSANHVFPANSNTAYQPALNSSTPVQIGQLVVRDSTDDFALIKVHASQNHKVKAGIKNLGLPKHPVANLLETGKPVKKSGASGVTIGTIDYVSVAVLNPQSNQIDTHLFTILPDPAFATDGDSGSIVVRQMNENGQIVNYPVGILFKKSSNNPFPTISDNTQGNVYYFARNFLDITTLTQAAVVQSDPI